MELQKKILITYKFDTLEQMKLAMSLTKLRLSMFGSCLIDKEQYDILYNLQNKKANPELRHIFNTVSNYYGVSDVKSNKREYVKPRQIAHYLAKCLKKYSDSEIGSIIGGKNRATVIYSDKVIKDELSYNVELAEEIESIKEKLNGI